MGSIYAKTATDGKPRYHIRYKAPDGKWKSEAGGKYKKNAQALLSRREAELANGEYGKGDDISFAAFSSMWLEDFASTKKQSTYDDYDSIIRTHLRPYFKTVLLKDITPGQCQRFVTSMRNAGKAPRTINKSIMVMKLMLKHAIIWEYLKDNPARYVEREHVPRVERDFLTPAEVEKFLTCASPDYHALFCTAVLTGAREGELLGLRGGDLADDKRRLHIRRSYNPRHGFSSTKTKAGERTVHLTPELLTVLLEHKANTAGTIDDLMFSKDGEPLSPANMVRDQFRPALARAGVRSMRFHDLRHTYAALMIHLGENMKFIQAQMGHTSIKTTMDLYGHLLPEASEGMGQRLDSLVFTNGSPTPPPQIDGSTILHIERT